MKIRKLAVIGVGLIGGSLARALRAAGRVDEIVGCGRSLENLEKAVELDATSVDIVHELKIIYYKLYGVDSAKFKEMDKLEKSLK